MTDLLTAEQAAELLGCEAETVKDKLASRKLPGVKFGREWRIPARALLDHLDELARENLHADPSPKPAAIQVTPKSRQPPRLVNMN